MGLRSLFGCLFVRELKELRAFWKKAAQKLLDKGSFYVSHYQITLRELRRFAVFSRKNFPPSIREVLISSPMLKLFFRSFGRSLLLRKRL